MWPKAPLEKRERLVISTIKLGKREKLPGGFVVRSTSSPEKKNGQIQCI